jgi:hypothetical protein
MVEGLRESTRPPTPFDTMPLKEMSEVICRSRHRRA